MSACQLAVAYARTAHPPQMTTNVVHLPTKCRYVNYTVGTPTKCDGTAVLSGYCVDHVPDHITRQHFTRTLTAKVLGLVRDVLNDAADNGGLPDDLQLVDNLATAMIELDEWKRL